MSELVKVLKREELRKALRQYKERKTRLIKYLDEEDDAEELKRELTHTDIVIKEILKRLKAEEGIIDE